MTSIIRIVTASIAAASLYSSAIAQPSATTKSRDEVREETRRLEREGKLAPAGEGPQVVIPRISETTRAQRKATTRAAEKAGILAPAGDGADKRLDEQTRATPSTVDRDARKAETRALEKAGKLTPAGEGPGAPRK